MTNSVINKDIKSQRKFVDSYFHNILGYCDVLPNYALPQLKWYAIITYKHGIY